MARSPCPEPSLTFRPLRDDLVWHTSVAQVCQWYTSVCQCAKVMWWRRSECSMCQGEPVCHPSVPAQPAAPVARRWCRSTCSARAVRFRWSRHPSPTPFTHRPTLAHLGTLAHPGTPVPTAGVPGSANSNRLKVRLRRFPAPTAEVISGLAHWHTCISFFY